MATLHHSAEVDLHDTPTILQPMQCDPRYAQMREPNGSWVGAVRFDHGSVLLLGALGLDAHVALHGSELRGWYDGGTAPGGTHSLTINDGSCTPLPGSAASPPPQISPSGSSRSLAMLPRFETADHRAPRMQDPRRLAKR